MAHHKKQLLVLFCLALIQPTINSHVAQTLYHQINPDLLKNINFENLSTADQSLATACQLTDLHGLKYPATLNIIWEAIQSIQMIDEILPRLHRTHTTFGYMALAQQCAQMSPDITKLRKKTDLIKYLETHPEIFSKLNLAIKRAAPSEEAFLALCKAHNEEEQNNQKTINKKLYYTSSIGSKLNENSYALGFWTRLNQLHTLAWYTIPTLRWSNQDIESSHNKDRQNLHFKQYDFDFLNSDKARIQEEITTLEKKIKDNPLGAQKAYDNFIAGIAKIDATKQTPFEKEIAQTSKENLLVRLLVPCMQSGFSNLESLKYLSKYALDITRYYITDGMLHAPAYYADCTKSAATVIKDQFSDASLYCQIKKDLVRSGWNNDEFKTKAVAASYSSLGFSVIATYYAIYPYILYYRYNSTKELFDLVAEKQKDLVQISHLIQSLQRVHQILKSNPSLQVGMPEHKLLARLFDPYDKRTSSDLKALISSCLSSSFSQEAYYLSQQGKILAVHHLFMRTKSELTPYLQAFGAIDAYLSTYKLYEEFKNHPTARICLPEYTQHETPQLIAHGFWHPLINPSKVVTNSLSMGVNGLNVNLMITGPNAGGKTTSLMALIINIVMAQSYGIATATRLSFTPFTKIHSYLDITTNLLNGESLFKAEVNRSKKLKESILSCTPGEKTFTIIDELFTGTNPEVASNVGFKFGELLGNIEHSMSIITTHFPRLTELEEETNRFTNYKVADAHIAQDGTVTYPFKLEKGKSTQNIAEHMLEQEGII